MESKAWADDIKGEYTPPPPDPKKPRARKPHWIPYVASRRDIHEVLDSPKLAGPEALVLRTLYASGMRAEELVALRREDLQPETGALQVGERLAMVDEETFRQLSELDWKTCWRWNLVAVKGILRDAARGCTLGRRYAAMGRTLLPHALRVAFAVDWLEKGGGLFALHRQLGYPWLGDTECLIEVSVGLWRGVYDRSHPLALGEARKPQSQLSVEEVEMAIEACGVGPRGSPNALMLRVIYAAGMRVGELCDLLVADVGLETGCLFLRKCKEQKDRFALIDAGTVELLRPFVEGRPMVEPLFLVDHEAVKDSFIQSFVQDAGNRTGLLKKYNDLGLAFSPHTFRHAFASHVYAGGMEPATIKRLMGHQSVEETMGYVDCRPVRQREAYDRVSVMK